MSVIEPFATLAFNPKPSTLRGWSSREHWPRVAFKWRRADVAAHFKWHL